MCYMAFHSRAIAAPPSSDALDVVTFAARLVHAPCNITANPKSQARNPKPKTLNPKA